jgi:hypothetical protein
MPQETGDHCEVRRLVPVEQPPTLATQRRPDRFDPLAGMPLLVLFTAHMAVRIWTIASFAPTIIAFQHLPPSAEVDSSLVASAALWRNLNYLRVGVFVAISLALLPLIGRVATQLHRSST